MFALVLLQLLTTAASDEVISSAHAAQVRLAETLGGAESIDAITVSGTGNDRGVVFDVVVRGEPLRLTAKTRKHQVTSLVVARDPNRVPTGALAWLGDELAGAAAVTTLVVDEDDDVTIGLADGRRYMIIPGRGSGGPAHGGPNEAVEARWAAAWN